MLILVDVMIPELNRTVDFQLEDQTIAWDIAEEIASMAAQVSGRTFSMEGSGVVLYSVDKKRQIDLSKSLQANGIHSGARLMLI